MVALASLGAGVLAGADRPSAAASRASPCPQPRIVQGRLACGDDSAAAVRAACPGLEIPPPGSRVDVQCRARADASLMRALAVPVDINRGSVEALQSLPGVGPVLAGRIVAARPLDAIEALLDVKGIGPTKLRRIRQRVQVVAHP